MDIINRYKGNLSSLIRVRDYASYVWRDSNEVNKSV